MVTSELWLPSIYDDAEKLRFIGILAYPKKTMGISVFMRITIFYNFGLKNKYYLKTYRILPKFNN
jgi:hypothetical protein